MAVEMIDRFLLQHLGAPSHSSSRTQITFEIGAGMSGSIQLKHWIDPGRAPALEQLPAFLHRSDAP